MRQGEIIGLKWKDIDFEKKTININKSRESSTKNNQARTISLTDNLANMLMKQKEKCYNSKYVFPNKSGEIRRSDFRSPFKSSLKRAGLSNKEFTFHDLRHTAASLLAKSGASLPFIQKILGHADYKTTLIYAHLVEDDLRSVMNNAEQMIIKK